MFIGHYGVGFGAKAAAPPSARAVAWACEAQWLFVLWAWWVDRHRCPRLGR